MAIKVVLHKSDLVRLVTSVKPSKYQIENNKNINYTYVPVGEYRQEWYVARLWDMSDQELWDMYMQMK